METYNVDSTAIKRFTVGKPRKDGYRRLSVVFADGTVGHYRRVPATKVATLVDAVVAGESVGRAFNQSGIRAYRWTKVTK